MKSSVVSYASTVVQLGRFWKEPKLEVVGKFFDPYPCPDEVIRGFLRLYCRPAWKSSVVSYASTVVQLGRFWKEPKFEVVGKIFDPYPCPDEVIRGFLRLYCRPAWKLGRFWKEPKLEVVGKFFDLYPCPDEVIRGFLRLYCRPAWKVLESKPLSSGECVAFKGSKASFVIQQFAHRE
ncbi:SUN domain-containing protein [Sergentomyia squamirostris]